MKADALWSPQVVVAGVTCGGALYSIGPPKILEGATRKSWKVQ